MVKPLNADVVERFKDVVMKSDVVEVLVLTKNMEIVWYNEALGAEFDASRDYLGRKCHEVFGGSAEPHDGCLVRGVLETGKAAKRVVTMGEGRYLEIVIPIDDGHVGELIVPLDAEGETT